MKETVLVTGANGFLAKHLIPLLLKKFNVKLLTRTPESENEYAWDLNKGTIDEKALDEVSYIVHLSGSKLFDGKPFTEEKMRLAFITRSGASDFLREKIKERKQRLKAFISASAIGYYGFTDNTLEIDETGDKGQGFNAELCEAWEKAADRFKTEGLADHVCKIRVSLALGKDGGIFPQYKDLFLQNPDIALKPDNSGLPWNHIDDMAGIFAFAIENRLDGVYNSVSPHPASYQDIFKAISNNISGSNYEIQPFRGKHLVSHKIINAGYVFQFPDIEKAVKNILQ